MIVKYGTNKIEILEGNAIRPKYFRFVDLPDIIYMTETRKHVNGMYTCTNCDIKKDSSWCGSAPRCGPDSQVNDLSKSLTEAILGRTPNEYCHFKVADYSIAKYDAPTVETLNNV